MLSDGLILDRLRREGIQLNPNHKALFQLMLPSRDVFVCPIDDH